MVNGIHSQNNEDPHRSASPQPSKTKQSQLNGKVHANGLDLYKVNVALAENGGALSVRSEDTREQTTSRQALSSRVNGSQNGAPRRLARAKTEQDLKRNISAEVEDNGAEQNWELRHGWEDQYNSEEYLHLLSSVCLRHP